MSTLPGEGKPVSDVRRSTFAAHITFSIWPDLTKILNIVNPTSIYTLPEFNKVIIHHNHEIISYSLDMFARLSLGQTSQSGVESTYERVSGSERNVLFCKPGVVGNRTMCELLAPSSVFRGPHQSFLSALCCQEFHASDDICA